ncbi:Uncharacterised protein [Mycobacteroides abscessus subsp. massiliense]|nr:Uncharacterised protein [Mycobacteroides abscessus subsp. massiliense]
MSANVFISADMPSNMFCATRFCSSLNGPLIRANVDLVTSCAAGARLSRALAAAAMSLALPVVSALSISLSVSPMPLKPMAAVPTDDATPAKMAGSPIATCASSWAAPVAVARPVARAGRPPRASAPAFHLRADSFAPAEVNPSMPRVALLIEA